MHPNEAGYVFRRILSFDHEATVRQMVAEQTDMKIPSELIPKCPVCGAPMAINLRCDMTFVQDDGWYAASNRYDDFIRRHQNLHILFLELGVGTNTPVIIKNPFWRMTSQNPKAVKPRKNAFKIILPNINAKYKKGSNSVLPSEPLVNNSDGVQTSARGEKVLEYARLHGAVTRNDIIGLLGVSSSTAVRILKKLVKSNLLKQNGRARSTRYTIVK